MEQPPDRRCAPGRIRGQPGRPGALPGIAGRLICLALPWLPYLAYWALWHSGQVARAASPATLLYFYPWALGLTLIQTAKLWRLAPGLRRRPRHG